ncbi:MAG: hypothetical protein JXQ90_18010 [Cyclobacteriaceae bacterium]
MNSLTKIFEKDPESFPECVIFQEGIYDYIEDVCDESKPKKCSEENRLKIEAILNAHKSQKEILQIAIDYELKNGKGSHRKFIEQGIKKIKLPKSILEMPEWKSLEC